MTRPLVTIGIPTYSRRPELMRAVSSARSQSYPSLEILVADDASTDDSASAVSAIAVVDPRVRLHVHRQNLGHAANYAWVLANASGEYFMWLADDDWIEPDQVAAGVAVLESHGECALASFGAVHAGRGRRFVEPPLDLRSPSAAVRTVRFFAGVTHNSGLFGVARTEDLRKIGFPNRFGGDWLTVASLAQKGLVYPATQQSLHRSLDGLSSDSDNLAATEFASKEKTSGSPHLQLARSVGNWIARGDGASAFGSDWQRLCVAVLVYVSLLARFVIVPAMNGRTVSKVTANAIERRDRTSRMPAAR